MDTKRKVGRPTSYQPEYPQMLLDYFARPAWDVKGKDGEIVEGYFPTLAGFCWEIGTTQVTLRSWAHAKDIDGTPMWPEFLIAYEAAKERQEQIFTLGYLKGKYVNPAIGALVAKNLMDWRDKQEIESQVTQTVDMTTRSRVEIDFSDIVEEAKQADS